MNAPSFLRDLQFRLEYALLRLVVGTVRAIPLDKATKGSAWFWRHLAPVINPKRHKRALDNLAIAFPEKPEAEREAIALKHWENLGRVMAETMQLDRIIADPTRIRIKDEQIFNRYKGKLGPIVGASLHLGNWGACHLAAHSFRRNPGRRLSLRQQSLRRPLSARAEEEPLPRWPVRPRRRGRRSRRKPEDRARHHGLCAPGGRLGLVCDLYDRTGLPVPFFGKDAATVTIPAMIARRTGGRIWMSRCYRLGTDSHFEIELKELRVPRTVNQGEDVKWATAAMTRQFEAWVREMPEQWMWSNRRWS